MTKATVLAALLLLLSSMCILAADSPPKVEVTRTSLHVARSLDPEAVETLNVRTRNGDVASLIVKRRGGKSKTVPDPVSVISSPVQVESEEEEDQREAKKLKVPPPVYIRSSPMYIKGQQQQDWKRSRGLISIDKEGIPVVTGVRMPDDESDRQVWRNARVINNVLVPNTQPIPQYSTSPYMTPVVTPGVQYSDSIMQRDRTFQPLSDSSSYYTATRDRILERIKTINAQENAVRARMLRRSDTPSSEFQARLLQYPTSPVQYPADATKQSRVSFEEGVRTPVLQYAHPELGVQVARKQDEIENAEDNGTQQEMDNGLLAYFAQDIHSDRSPYAYEPGVDNEEDRSETTLYDKRSQDEQDSYSYGLANDKYIRRYPYSGYNVRYTSYNQIPTYGYKIETRPFWERVKDHVQTSMDKVSDLARPVVEPLVEATQKISHNLGLSSTSETMIQEKVGNAMTTYPVLLPALGLVAGGAALGLGAVAVGRFLDIDLMKRSNPDQQGELDDKEMSAEHKRALEQLVRSLAARELQSKTEDTREKKEDSHQVSRRSLEDNAVSAQSAQQAVPGAVSDWAHTPCAKKIFCDVMVHQSTDNVMLMEKKVATLLALIQHSDAAVSFHLNDVMDAVKRRDCSAYTCPAS